MSGLGFSHVIDGRITAIRSCRVLEYSCPVFDGCGLGQTFENAAEIGRVTKAAPDGHNFQFEIVIAQEEFAARNADVGQVIDERHVTMTMKHAREMVGADGEEMRHGIARDVVLIVALQINTDAFEKTLAAIFSLRRGGFVDQSFDT